MTNTTNPETSSMIERIFSSIDSVGNTLESTVDLKDDVAPFMLASLAKIKQLSLVKQDFETLYQLMQIATNYLPRVVESYCGLPIEYRNTKILKDNKSARSMLVQDLKIFKKQITEIESNIYSGLENQIQVNSKVIRDKYETQFQLADEVDALGDQGFIDQFDYNKYAKTPNYKSIAFKKEPDKAKEIRQEKINNIKEKTISTTRYLLQGVLRLVRNIFRGIFAFIAGFFEFLSDSAFPIIMVGFVVCIFGGMFYGISRSEISRNYVIVINSGVKSVYQLMSVSQIPSKEFENFVKEKQTMMFNESSKVKKNVSFSFDTTKSVMTINAKDLDEAYCKMIIDNKEMSYDKATVLVNGIALPQDMTSSNFYIAQNENHTLCHLNEGNKVSIELNNKIIYDNAQAEKVLPKKQIDAKVENITNELIPAEKAFKEMGSKNSSYSYTYSYINELKEKLKNLKALKGV